MPKRQQQGFSLIELMIVVAIIAILAGVAYPSYQQYVRRTAIADAELALNGLAQAMERHRAQTGSYAGAADANGVPTIYRAQSPADGTAQFNLRIVVANTNATAYDIRAIAVGGPVEANATLTLDALGNLGGSLASEVSHGSSTSSTGTGTSTGTSTGTGTTTTPTE